MDPSTDPLATDQFGALNPKFAPLDPNVYDLLWCVEFAISRFCDSDSLDRDPAARNLKRVGEAAIEAERKRRCSPRAFGPGKIEAAWRKLAYYFPAGVTEDQPADAWDDVRAELARLLASGPDAGFEAGIEAGAKVADKEANNAKTRSRINERDDHDCELGYLVASNLASAIRKLKPPGADRDAGQCPEVISGERCGRRAGHYGKHVWANGD